MSGLAPDQLYFIIVLFSKDIFSQPFPPKGGFKSDLAAQCSILEKENNSV